MKDFYQEFFEDPERARKEVERRHRERVRKANEEETVLDWARGTVSRVEKDRPLMTYKEIIDHVEAGTFEEMIVSRVVPHKTKANDPITRSEILAIGRELVRVVMVLQDKVSQIEREHEDAEDKARKNHRWR
jgi:hypothetical protein